MLAPERNDGPTSGVPLALPQIPPREGHDPLLVAPARAMSLSNGSRFDEPMTRPTRAPPAAQLSWRPMPPKSPRFSGSDDVTDVGGQGLNGSPLRSLMSQGLMNTFCTKTLISTQLRRG